MKKIFIVLIVLVFYTPSVLAVEKFKFRYNLHENLPKKWVTEFKNIMNIMQEVMPINGNTNDWVTINGNTNDWVMREMNYSRLGNESPMNIYAWLNTIKDPFPEFKKNMNGSSINSDGTTMWMQLKVYKQDFGKNRSGSYATVVHEYFHIHQQALSKYIGTLDKIIAKWLVEGGATVIGEIYARQYYGKDSLKSNIQDRGSWKIRKVTKEPHLYEKYKTSPQKGYDSNYAGSAFMVLALVNELKKNNISEEEAFELVFREIWVQRSKQPKGSQGWKDAFELSFGMTVEDFYQRLSKYKRKDLKKILPSKTLKIQDIFS